MQNKTKIAFVLGSLTSGGAERVVTTLSNSFVEKYDVTIITFKKSEPFYKLHDAINVVSCMEDIKPSKNLFNSLLLNFSLLRNLIKLLRANNIDLVIGFITMANVLTILSAKFLKIPCIVSERNNPYIDATPGFWKLCRKYTYPLANSLVVQTKLIKEFYSGLVDNDKIAVLPNPISPLLSDQRNFDADKENIILNVGKLHDQKNQTLLIKAFNDIEYGDWKLYIIGEGQNRSILENLISELGLRDNVFLLGRKNNIHDYYNKAKVFAFTSNYEGFPNALIEAMHFGLPCVSTDCPTGPSELITNGENGYLVPMDNKEELAKRLQLLISDAEIRTNFSSKSLNATKDFNISTVLEKWENVIEYTLNNKK
ncbi:glycosyltransferase family 4 protein [Flagellimonas okinawensis]|uniref:Glycosyltransferase family 4 protein n=1 Tax=Flagellimonas okinawensis TaxID=3031324 RepID=A0ABT5XR11_9FLAO|nr:glycosyltransferase family 4 protein [[Muricauda] okinawensis]MDF0708338.1 glycosyltransferase family 4 protein [[Muricauda] okinawensis]